MYRAEISWDFRSMVDPFFKPLTSVRTQNVALPTSQKISRKANFNIPSSLFPLSSLRKKNFRHCVNWSSPLSYIFTLRDESERYAHKVRWHDTDSWFKGISV